MRAVWIALYVVGAVATVPVYARAMYDPDGGINSERSDCIVIAIGACWAWPVIAGTLLLAGISKRLVPLIFRTGEGDRRG